MIVLDVFPRHERPPGYKANQSRSKELSAISRLRRFHRATAWMPTKASSSTYSVHCFWLTMTRLKLIVKPFSFAPGFQSSECRYAADKRASVISSELSPLVIEHTRLPFAGISSYRNPLGWGAGRDVKAGACR